MPPSLRQIVILPRHQSLKIWARERGRPHLSFLKRLNSMLQRGDLLETLILNETSSGSQAQGSREEANLEGVAKRAQSGSEKGH